MLQEPKRVVNEPLDFYPNLFKAEVRGHGRKAGNLLKGGGAVVRGSLEQTMF